jgi:hypothetical protein
VSLIKVNYPRNRQDFPLEMQAKDALLYVKKQGLLDYKTRQPPVTLRSTKLRVYVTTVYFSVLWVNNLIVSREKTSPDTADTKVWSETQRGFTEQEIRHDGRWCCSKQILPAFCLSERLSHSVICFMTDLLMTLRVESRQRPKYS